MGKPARGSRKGKKAWRANIATDELDDFYAKSTNDVLTGAAALPSAPSDQLFFLDKSSDIPVKRKIEKAKGKLLNYENVFKKNPFVQVIPSSSDKKLKTKKKKAKKAEKVENEISLKVEETTTLTDIWDNKGGAASKSKKNKSVSIIPAVELEPPGCSFNPPFEAHQDALAKAVADEMHKIYKKELGPEPVPLTVPGEEITEEDMYFLDADNGNESEGGEDESNAENGAPAKQSKTRKLTKVELNRKARHKEQLRADAERKKLKNLSKEIDSLPKIMEEIAKEDEEKNRRHTRRVVAKQERLKSGPPRLGKHKFEPAPMQVLLSEEISGSLRKLKGCPTLTRDRFKSFEKRGLIVPRAKGSSKK